MKILNCPITGEKILTIGANGVMKRENYAEVWFHLSDGSRMRVAMSRSAKEQLKESDTDELFRKIKKQWSDDLKGKMIPEKIKKNHLDRMTKLKYGKVEGSSGVIIEKQKDGHK